VRGLRGKARRAELGDRMKKPTITQREFKALEEVLGEGMIETARVDKWRPSELAMALLDIPKRIKKNFRVLKAKP
jgi:hypothetical protein